MRGHGYQQCPDRFAKSKGKSKGFGKFNGKKGESKKGVSGRTYYVDLTCIMTLSMVGTVPVPSLTRGPPRMPGIDCLHDLVIGGQFAYEVNKDDLPTFRFGNGQKDQAVSRVDLRGTSLGSLSFYVLGGSASGTPPLVGARTLRSKDVMLSYSDGLFRYRETPEVGQMAVQMKALASGHLTIDLCPCSQHPRFPRTPCSQPPRFLSFLGTLRGIVLELLEVNCRSTWCLASLTS